MAFTTINATNTQGRTFDIHADGTRMLFGRQVGRFIIKLPQANTKEVFFELGLNGKARVVEDVDNSAAHLKEAYPSMQNSEFFEYDGGKMYNSPNLPVDCIELRTANTVGAVADVRIILL